MSDKILSFPFAYTPEFNSNEYFQDIAMFENYESRTEALPIDDLDGMREVIREIDLDNFKPSGLNEMFLNFSPKSEVKDALLTEDEMLALIQKLRRDDSGSGKSNIEYMSTYQKPSKVRTEKLDSFRASLMEEKEEEEKKYYSNKNEYDECNSYYASSSNIFLNEIDELK